ncbi:rab11 family-interacting protein 3 isoform X1 [Sinocyclocheilus grahami]|uniref:rab11 family-interacting protein 3 isoform X1 n=1 Tax=Sinocyclocheilus grahami TaxID=75366 RepID=UPI0007ACC120|nr:PREDICTED: rab11 family-interacting protein 3-like isoform X1 [Sinocyclocheilus grahami]XP_016092081.1 PREDICTED: rab11 family-interacting protein 3-like isoform X1 [Sinocyclocheilus grahami]
MEQVLSSPQGCSEWEVSGKAEWESEQNPLGFLLMDKDNSSVGDSTNEIFQENAINLDELFWSSQYSGQTYSWENGLECVYPEWKTQPHPSQDLKGEGSPGGSEIVDGDLICFNSRSTSPTLSNIPVQNQNNFYDLHEQVPDFLQPVEVTATSNSLVVYTGEMGIIDPTIQSDKTILQETHLLEDTLLTNCEFGHNSLEERTFVNNGSQCLLPHGIHLTLESEGLLPVSPVELSCTDTNSNPKPSIICQTPLSTPEHIYLPSSTLSCEAIPPMTCTEPTALSFHEGNAPLPMNEMEMLLPGLLVGGLYSEQESSKPSASNETHDDDLQSQETTDANIEKTQLSSEAETVCRTPLGESCISPELCEEVLCDLSTECTFDVPLETVGEKIEEVASNATTDNVFSKAKTELTPIAFVDLQADDPLTESLLVKDEHKESTTALPVCTSEHNALIGLSPEDDILSEDHSQPTHSTEAEALSEVPYDGDIPDSMFEILTDSISCESVPSLDSEFPPVTDAVELTEQDKCDANSPDLKSNALTFEFQDNVTNVETDNVDSDPEAMETQRADVTPTIGNTEDSDTLKVLESSDLHQNQDVTNSQSKSDSLEIINLNLDNSKTDNNQELNAMSETCQEQVSAQQKESTLVENLTHLDQLNDSLTANSNAIVIDTPEENVTAHNDSHDTPPNVEEKLYSVSLQGGERSDYILFTQNQVIPHCASNPDSLESTPFTCAGDQLTVTGGLVGLDLTETASQLREATGEGEAEFLAQLTHQEDFHQLTPSQIDLAQEQQVSSIAPSSPPSHRNVFPCGASLDGEAYLTLMENNPDAPNIPKHAEMTLDLCKASDALPTKSLHDQRVPVDLINVPIVSATPHKSEEQSALRAVFQALDQDGDGFVHIEEFIEFAKAYGAEQVKDLTRFLDPSGLGVISFEDFHRGISAISNEGSDPDFYKTHLSAVEANGPPEEYDEQAEVSDSAYLGSESAYSECETFTDEDTTALVHPELHDDVETDSGIENTLTDGDDRNRFTLGSDLNGHTLVAVIGGEEEHFEDFGESNNTSDLLLANREDGGLGPEGEGTTEPHPDSPLPRPLMLLSPSPSSFPASFRSFLQSEALEFFCTHCHKQISRLEDLSTRLQLLEMNSSSKRLSSKKAARHLQQSGTLDVMGDLTQDILDLADHDITDKVLLLEKRVCELEKDSSESEEQHARLRQENLTLVHRANALEEQLKEQELRAEDDLLVHTRKHRDALNKLQRERDLEIENLQARLHQLDEENSELRSCVPCLRANIERLEEEKRKLQDEVDDVTDRLNEEIESRRKMADKLSHERHTNQKEKECTQGLIEDLRKQLEHLQLFKLETEVRRGRSASSGLQEYNTHMKENELEQEIRRLKQDNRSLKEQNDELNGQIINLSIQGAKSLFTESLSESLAAEINNVSRAELMEAIHKQEEINFRLQDYIDRIIVAIMECNPSILEVK